MFSLTCCDWGVDETEERLVNEEYKIWKKNTPFLYGTPVVNSTIALSV